MNPVLITPLFPINGDVLHHLDGEKLKDGLSFTAKVSAAPGSSITINDRPAKETASGLFAAPVFLNQYENELEIKDQSSGGSLLLTVFYTKNFAHKYRLSVDDNIRFMQDIARHAHQYSSIFDNPYLKGLREIHTQYKTRVHLNLFYQSVDGDFTLAEFPDIFKGEWQENADWLRLSFHSYAEFPDAPYKHAGYPDVKQDCDLIKREIKRFAGEPLLGPVTTIHWGELNVEGAKAVRSEEYKALVGYFNVDDDRPSVSYYLNVEQRRHMKKRFIWKDESTDIIFVRSSMVLDKTKQEDIVPEMNAYAVAPSGLPPYVDYLIHEQYYYPDYAEYQPDYFDKIETAVRWTKDHGYEPSFLDHCIFE